MDALQLDHLDQIARDILQNVAGARESVGVLSTGERLYVALAANDISLAPGYTIAQAIYRLEDWELKSLAQRWAFG